MLADRIDQVLPQTQCGRCGYTGCRPYAEALARGECGLNRCPPGGVSTIEQLAAMLGREVLPLDPSCGPERPWGTARIDETLCIGCTKCIQACPVDAIVGAAKRMHTVIEAQCTGCELCLAPCPVDCIEWVPMRSPWDAQRALAARERFDARGARRTREERRRTEERAGPVPAAAADPRDKQRVIAEAIARTRARRTQLTSGPATGRTEIG